MPKKEIVECLKRTAESIWKENGSLKRIEYLGFKNLPYKGIKEGIDTKFKEGSLFLYTVSLNTDKRLKIKPEVKLDLDIVKATWTLTDSQTLPEDYECTLDEECRIPIERPSLKPLLKFANVRTSGNKAMSRQFHTDSQDSQAISAPGLMSIFSGNPKRLHRIQFLDQLFRAHGHEIRIAGGAVRDILRGETPNDIDFATTAHPDESLKILSKYKDVFRIIITETGRSHGTVAVKYKGLNDVNFARISEGRTDEVAEVGSEDSEIQYDDESPFEITTLRKESSTDGRHAEVVFIDDWKLDAERRDLTINAMFLTINDGKLIDFFNGESDLRNGVVRFVGDADTRIKEDYLRILRFFRFWSRYGSSKAPGADQLDAIRRNLTGLTMISGERIWTEMKKILSTYPFSPVVDLLLQAQFFHHIEIVDEHRVFDKDVVINEANKVQAHLEEYHRCILEPKLKNGVIDLSEYRKAKELLASVGFAAICVDLDMCFRAYKRLRLSNVCRDIILDIVEKREKKDDDLNVKSIKRYLFIERSKSQREINRQRIIHHLIYEGKIDLVREVSQLDIPELPISGREVACEAQKLHIQPKFLNQIIRTISEQWAESDYLMTKEELCVLMKKAMEEFAGEKQLRKKERYDLSF